VIDAENWSRALTSSSIRQKIALLKFNGNFDHRRFSRFQRLSASIGRFFHRSVWNGGIPPVGKKTVRLSGRDRQGL
jgi:hypothetical protein